MKKWALRALLILVAAGLGLAIGGAWRGRRDQEPSVESRETTTSNTSARLSRPGTAGDRADSKAKDDSPLATQLERSLSISSGVTRWLYWLEAIEKAAVSDFPRLAMLAKSDPA